MSIIRIHLEDKNSSYITRRVDFDKARKVVINLPSELSLLTSYLIRDKIIMEYSDEGYHTSLSTLLDILKAHGEVRISCMSNTDNAMYQLFRIDTIYFIPEFGSIILIISYIPNPNYLYKGGIYESNKN